LKTRTLLILFAAASLGTACNRYTQNSAAGNVIDPADAANSVVLHVKNANPASMELRTIQNGTSQFVGSVGGNDSTSVLLDPSILPAGRLFVVALPSDGRGRAVVGPLTVSTGDKIQFFIEPALDLSRAFVTR